MLRLKLPAGAVSSELDGISCDGLACMAVGMFGDAAGDIKTLAEHWTGRSWRWQRPANRRSPVNVLQDVSCNTATLCMAVGVSDRQVQLPLAELWQNGRWKVVPGPKVRGANLIGISCPGSNWCIAVGQANRKPLTEAWSGRHWRLMKTRHASGQPASAFSQISCRTLTDRCISVGTRYRPGKRANEATLAEWWNGRRWRVMSTRNP